MIPVEKAGAYGMIKQAEILHYLPEAEGNEFDRLDRRKNRTPAQERRLEELWDLAGELHEQHRRNAPPRTPENDLGLYAEQIGERMRARSDAVPEEQHLAGS